MNNKEKAKELGKRYSKPCHGVGDCEFEATQSALEMAQWKDEQFQEEKKELLGLVKMIKVDEHNQTIIEDLIAMLNL